MKAKWLMVPAAAAALLISGQATADLALAKKSGCLACHSVEKKIVGPGWKDVAAKYKGDAGARDRMIAKVAKGGKGNWTKVTGGAPMPPYSPRVSDENIGKLVDFILAL
jgi:cytochrome c